MYLHVGASVVIPEGDVLGIFDLDNTTSSRATRDFLARAEKAGQVQHFFTLMRYHHRENGRQGEYAGVSALT